VKILLAVDGSRYSEAAVDLVGALRIRRKADATILTVIPEHVFLGGHNLVDLLERFDSLKAQVRKAEDERASELLAKLSKSLGTRGLKVETLLHRGSPADEIIKTCRSIPADLVLVGFKGTSEGDQIRAVQRVGS